MTESVTCNHCGAPLDVPGSTKYLTCNHCGSRLLLKRTSSASYTEVLDNIARETDSLKKEVRHLRVQNELERLDREWGMERERFRVRTRDGRSYIPGEQSGAAHAAKILALIVFLGFFLAIGSTIARGASMSGAPSGFAMGPILIMVSAVLVVVSSIISSSSKRAGYRSARQRYRTRRGGIVSRLDR